MTSLNFLHLFLVPLFFTLLTNLELKMQEPLKTSDFVIISKIRFAINLRTFVY